MEENIQNNELDVMREQLRNIKAQVEAHTIYHESRLRKSMSQYARSHKIEYNYSFFMLAIITALLGIGGPVWLWKNDALDTYDIILFAVFWISMLWSFRKFIREIKLFRLDRIAQLDLLTAQTRLEEYRQYRESKKSNKKRWISAAVFLLFSVVFFTMQDVSHGRNLTGALIKNIVVWGFYTLIMDLVLTAMTRHVEKKENKMLEEIETFRKMETTAE